MSKATRGPWVVDLRTEGRIYVAQQHGDGPGGRICEVFQNCLVRGKTQAVNAALLAASPDLLEQLRVTVMYLQSACLVMDKESRQMALDVVRDARAAMAKATGAA